MKNIPEGISEEVVVIILRKVSARIARNKKYIFDGHTEDDIVQQGVLEGIKCLARGDYVEAKGKGVTPEDSLERFMSVHIKRRLGNYKRDMMRKNNGGGEVGIISPMPLTDLCMAIGDDGPDHVDVAMHKEVLGRIKSALSATPEYLTDFYRLMDGSSLPSQRKIKLRQKITEIMSELERDGQEED